VLRNRSFILTKQRIGIILVLLLVILLSPVLIGIMPANGIAFIENVSESANRTLVGLHKNLTSSIVSLALNQVNDSRHSSEPRDALTDLEMANTTIKDLVIGLSNNSDDLNPSLYEENACEIYTVDCIIVDLKSALGSIADNRLEAVEQVLQKLNSKMR
jgi:hypothetical protein